MEENSVISTNLFIIKLYEDKEALLLTRWFYSVFSQIDMELKNLDQEGMRKLEKDQIGNLYCPNLLKLTPDQELLLIDLFYKEDPLDFQS